MNFQTMNKQRKAILITAVIGIVAMFLPWVKITVFGMSSSANGMHGRGFIIFACFVGAGVAAFLGDQTKTLEKKFWFISLICGGLATLLMLLELISASSKNYFSYLSFGFYLAIVAAVGVLVSSWLFRSPTDSIKGGFDSLKSDIHDRTKPTGGDTPQV